MQRRRTMVSGVLLTGCDEPKHVSWGEFKREFNLRNAQTTIWSKYLGETNGMVYLRRKTMSLIRDNWKEEMT